MKEGRINFTIWIWIKLKNEWRVESILLDEEIKDDHVQLYNGFQENCFFEKDNFQIDTPSEKGFSFDHSKH